LGAAWWLLLALGLAGIVTIAVTGGALQRVLAVVALSAIVAFLVMPTSAGGPEGTPFLFQGNLRYEYPGLALAVLLLATVPRMRDRNVHATALLVVATAFAATVLGVHSPLRLGWDDAGANTAAWAHGLHAKIGLINEPQQYAYYGPSLENTVQYVGVVSAHGGFHDIDTCPALRVALASGGYRYVVVGVPLVAAPSSPGTRGLEWMASDPAATLVVHESGHDVFALDGSSTTAGCPPP
jgi:hypothetical protein